MSLTTSYKNGINYLCEINNTISAEDILKKASETDNIVSFSKGSKVKSFSSVGKVAAFIIGLLVISSSSALAAGYAGYGPLAFIFGNKQEDVISQDLISQGYYYEAEVKLEGKDCDLIFHGITGDNTKPMMLFTLDIHDPEIYENQEKLYVSLYPGMEENRYDNERVDLFDDWGGHYCYSEAEAIRDENNHNLYHFQVMGMCNMYDSEATYVIAMRNIMFYGETEETLWIDDIDYRWSFDPSLNPYYSDLSNDGVSSEKEPLAQTGELTFADESCFMVVDCIDNNGIAQENDHYSHNDQDICITTKSGVKLHLRFAEFGLYETEVNMYMDLEENSDFADLCKNEAGNEIVDNDFERTFSGSKLIADGNEIAMQSYGIYWFDFEGIVSSKARGYIAAMYDPIGTAKPESLVLVMADGTEYVLK